MATPLNEIKKIAARARRIGWEVETSHGAQAWVHRITAPECDDAYCTHRVQLHGTPSDRYWKENVIRELNRHGFEEAENAFLQQEEEARRAAIDEDRRKNDIALAKAQQRLVSVTKASGPFGPQIADIGWLFQTHELPETRRVLVPPELSRKILDELNTANRPLRIARTRYWSNIMAKKKFKYTHQGIAFNTLGQLQDGQHRLAASLAQQYTLDINVTVGMPVENFEDIDTGFGRTGTDTFSVWGKDFPATYSAGTRLVAAYDKYGSELRLGLRQRISNAELRLKASEYGTALEQAVALAREITSKRDGLRISPNSLTAAIYLISRNLPENDSRVMEFLRGYSEGTYLNAGDSRIALRSFSANVSVDKRRIPVEDQLAVIIKAWNAFANGRAISQLTIRKDEMMPKPFVPKPEESEE